MKLDALDHPKTHALTSILDISRPTAIGHMELLWAFTGKNAPQGNIGKWSNGAIARACEWLGDPDQFVSALIEARFLDLDAVHRVSVHDWHEHAPGWVRAKLKGLNQQFIAHEAKLLTPSPHSSPPGSTQGSPPGTAPSILGKRNVAKGSEAYTEGANPRTEPKGQVLQLDERELMDAFAAVRMAYPPRTGRDVWLKAEHNWRMRIDEGIAPEQLLSGVERYARFVAAGGVSNPKFVMGPDNFFGAADKPWSQTWEPPLSKPDSLTQHNLAAAEEFMRRTEPA